MKITGAFSHHGEYYSIEPVACQGISLESMGKYATPSASQTACVSANSNTPPYLLPDSPPFPVHLSIKIWVINHFGWNFPWVYLFPIMLVFNIPIVNFIRMYLPFMLGIFSMRIGKRRRVLINKQGRHP